MTPARKRRFEAWFRDRGMGLEAQLAEIQVEILMRRAKAESAPTRERFALLVLQLAEAAQELSPDDRRAFARHVDGVARGMRPPEDPK